MGMGTAEGEPGCTIRPLMVETLCSHLPPIPNMNKVGEGDREGPHGKPPFSRISSRVEKAQVSGHACGPWGPPTCHPSLHLGEFVGRVRQALPDLCYYS